MRLDLCRLPPEHTVLSGNAAKSIRGTLQPFACPLRTISRAGRKDDCCELLTRYVLVLGWRKEGRLGAFRYERTRLALSQRSHFLRHGPGPRDAPAVGGTHILRTLNADLSEYAVVSIATMFAGTTGINGPYDSTFGTFSQYLALFLWAAGAGTGGNAFKELGPTSTAGGRSDVTLPTAQSRSAG